MPGLGLQKPRPINDTGNIEGGLSGYRIGCVRNFDIAGGRGTIRENLLALSYTEHYFRYYITNGSEPGPADAVGNDTFGTAFVVLNRTPAGQAPRAHAMGGLRKISPSPRRLTRNGTKVQLPRNPAPQKLISNPAFIPWVSLIRK